MLKMRIVVGVVGCTLLALVAAGCVRAKPERVREPLPTLPVEVTAGEEPLAEEALALPELEESEPAEEAASPAEVDTDEPEEAAPIEEEQAPPATPEPTPTPAPTATPEPTPTPYAGPVYVVAPGDTLSSIAALHGSTVQAFMEANNLSNSAAIAVGMELRLPPGVPPLYEREVENTATYVVRAGDTLTQIAARHRMLVSQLLALNPTLRDPNLLRPGMELTVVVNPIPEGALVYVVQPGDTLASIARRYGVSVVELARANYMTDANRLEVGQQLVIPQN